MQNQQQQEGVVITVELSQLIQQYVLSVVSTKGQPVAMATQILNSLQSCRPIALPALQKAIEMTLAQEPEQKEPTFTRPPGI